MQLRKRCRPLAGPCAAVGLLTLCSNAPYATPEETAPTVASPTSSIPAGAIPARGLFNFREGTVEARVQLNFDPAEAVDGYTARGQIFRLEVPVASNDLGAGASFFFYSLPSSHKGDDSKPRSFLRAGFSRDGKDVPNPLMAECTHWKPGEWHHIAVTWQQGRRMEIFFDGREVLQRGEYARVEFPTSAERDIPAGTLLYLVPANQPSGVVIDEFRLSSVARTPQELQAQQAPLKPDPFTLLLENFENVKTATGGGYTASPYLATRTASPGIALTGGRVIPGKFGQAWAFGAPAKE